MVLALLARGFYERSFFAHPFESVPKFTLWCCAHAHVMPRRLMTSLDLPRQTYGRRGIRADVVDGVFMSNAWRVCVITAARQCDIHHMTTGQVSRRRFHDQTLSIRVLFAFSEMSSTGSVDRDVRSLHC